MPSPRLLSDGKPLQSTPDDAGVQYWLTHAYCVEDRFAEALSAIDRAIDLDREDPAYLCIRADVLLGLERYEGGDSGRPELCST